MQHSITYCHVPRETIAKAKASLTKYETSINRYIDLLLWWNQRINLVSRDVSRETIVKHIQHSLLLHALEAFQESEFVVDAGTGGGLPGIPLAITHPDKKFLLNDIVSKKIMAVKQMARELDLKHVETFNGSIEKVKTDHSFLLISKHAFKINNLIQMAKSLPWSTIIFYKGLEFKDELTGIETSLNIHVYKLSEYESFYHDKALIIVSR